jgi:hypothetical protein
MSDSGSDDEEDPVGNEDGELVAHAEEAIKQDKEEEEGDRDEEGRAMKKAKI